MSTPVKYSIMNLNSLLALAVCALCFVSCDFDPYEDESALAGLETGNPYVRLLTGGATGTEEIVVSESTAASEDITVEYPFITGGDLTVQYTLGGTAEYGTIYTIEGATANGGTVTIPFDNDDPESTATPSTDITIEFVADTLVDGPQTIILKLESATSADGLTVDVGQGSIRSMLTINLLND